MDIKVESAKLYSTRADTRISFKISIRLETLQEMRSKGSLEDWQKEFLFNTFMAGDTLFN